MAKNLQPKKPQSGFPMHPASIPAASLTDAQRARMQRQDAAIMRERLRPTRPKGK